MFVAHFGNNKLNTIL